MSRPSCDRRVEIVRRVRSGLLDSPGSHELREHLASCQDCQETALLAAEFERERSSASAEVRLPDAGLVLWKARLRERRVATARAEEPVVYAERIARVCSVVGVGAFLVWQRHSISHWLGGAGLLTVASIAAALLATAFALYLVRAEE